MRRRIPFLTVAVATLLAMTWGNALAAIPGTLDSQQTGVAADLGPQSLLAQTFVPTLSGTLGTVEINTFTAPAFTVVAGPNTPSLTVEITHTSGGHPTSTILASESTTPLDDDWNVVTFSSPINVVAGTKYAILVTQGQAGLGVWNGACGNPYGPGAALILDVATWKTIQVFDPKSCLTDFAFRTYITVPTPSPSPIMSVQGVTAAPTPTPPPTSTGSSSSGDNPGNLSFLLVFAGLATAAAAATFASTSRRRHIRR
jgi:hypothetical protein